MMCVWSVMLWGDFVYVYLVYNGVNSGSGLILLINMSFGVFLLLRWMVILILSSCYSFWRLCGCV